MFLFRQCLILFITMSSSSIETEKVATWFVYAAIINTTDTTKNTRLPKAIACLFGCMFSPAFYCY